LGRQLRQAAVASNRRRHRLRLALRQVEHRHPGAGGLGVQQRQGDWRHGRRVRPTWLPGQREYWRLVRRASAGQDRVFPDAEIHGALVSQLRQHAPDGEVDVARGHDGAALECEQRDAQHRYRRISVQKSWKERITKEKGTAALAGSLFSELTIRPSLFLSSLLQTL